MKSAHKKGGRVFCHSGGEGGVVKKGHPDELLTGDSERFTSDEEHARGDTRLRQRGGAPVYPSFNFSHSAIR